MRRLTAEERETAITYDDSTEVATIYTANTALRKKLNKLCEQFPDTYQLKESNEFSSTYMCANKKLIKFGKPSKISEEERKARSENMKQIQLRRQSQSEKE